MTSFDFCLLAVLNFCEIVLLAKLIDRDVVVKVVVEHKDEEGKDGNQ